MRHEKNSSITSPETTPIDQMFVKDVLSKTLALLLLTIPVTRIKTDYEANQNACMLGSIGQIRTHIATLMRKNQKCSTWISQNLSTWLSKGLNKNVLDC